MAGKKVVVSLVSFILVVGAVIGVIAVMGRGGDEKASAATSTSNKAVTSMCESTEYKDACMKALSTAAKNESATPKDYIRAVIESTVDELKKGMQEALSVKKALEEYKAKTPVNEEIIQDCEDNLKYALEDLDELIMKTVDETNLQDFGKHAYDLRVWLTMIDIYQETCLDNLVDYPEQRKAMEDGLRNSTELTRVAVDIIYGFADILKALDISELNLDDLQSELASSKARKLLGEIEVDQDGFPTWLHPSDRKLLAAPGGPPPNAVVAKDGSGFKTIKEALATYPKNQKNRKEKFVVYVKAGVYDEIVTVEKYMKNVFMYGDGRDKTIITGNKNVAKNGGGASTTATFSALGMGFVAKSMTFKNTAGHEGHQAVALRVNGDHSAIYDCVMDGYQDTLYYHGQRQFYKNCVIYGTVDFIFGSGVCLIQDSDIYVRKGGPSQSNMVTADGGTMPHEASGLVLQNCRIMADKDLFPVRQQVATYLGRPWKPYARTVIMQSDIGDLIRPEGYLEWDPKVMHQKTAMYLEYANRGPGSNTASRVKWPNVRVINRNEALKYTAARLLDSNFQKNVGPWLKESGVPFYPELAA